MSLQNKVSNYAIPFRADETYGGGMDICCDIGAFFIMPTTGDAYSKVNSMRDGQDKFS